MSELVAAFVPLVFFWTLPLVPALYALVIGIIELITKPAPSRRDR